MFTPEELEIAVQKIESRIVKFRKKIKDLEELTGPIAPDNAIGRVSRMDAIVNRSVLEAGLADAKLTLSRLNLAAQKIKTNEFGFCDHCNAEIQKNRILALPETIYCIKCAQTW